MIKDFSVRCLRLVCLVVSFHYLQESKSVLPHQLHSLLIETLHLRKPYLLCLAGRWNLLRVYVVEKAGVKPACSCPSLPHLSDVLLYNHCNYIVL